MDHNEKNSIYRILQPDFSFYFCLPTSPKGPIMRQIVRFIITILSLGLVVSIAPAASAEASPTHWAGDIVYVENHAPGWPVRKAAEDLDNYSKLDLRVVRHCPAGAQCIKVYSVWNLHGPAVGTTTWAYSGGHTVWAKVYLERKWGNRASNRMRRATTCHELGHAIGLDHRRGNTCMNPSIGRHTRPTISGRERGKLRAWYN